MLKDQQQDQQNQDQNQQQQKQDQQEDKRTRIKINSRIKNSNNHLNRKRRITRCLKRMPNSFLNSVMQDEKDVQDKVKKQQVIQGGRLEKDW